MPVPVRSTQYSLLDVAVSPATGSGSSSGPGPSNLSDVDPYRILVRRPMIAHDVRESGRPLLHRRRELRADGRDAAQEGEIARRIGEMGVARLGARGGRLARREHAEELIGGAEHH